MAVNLIAVNMDAFYIVISILFLCLLDAAIVLWVIESRMTESRKSVIADKVDSGKGLRLEAEDVYLNVKDGLVTICDELPVIQEPVSAPVKEEDVPVAPIVDEPAVTVLREEEVVPEAEVAEEEEAVAEAESNYIELTSDSVVFKSSKNEKITFIDRYAALTPEMRALYDDIVLYILSNKDCKKSESSTAVTFKCKTDKIMRAVIKRGVVELNFMLINTDLHRFVREEGIKAIKINPVKIRLATNEDLDLAKRTADITIEAYRDEQKYRRDKRNEMRRKQRLGETVN